MNRRGRAAVGLVVVLAIGAAALVADRGGAASPAETDRAEVAVEGVTSSTIEPTTTTEEADRSAGAQEVTTPTEPGLPVLGEAPELVDLDGWLQSDVSSLDELRGKVVVLQFWTFGCVNCKNTLPHLQDLASAHAGEAFEIVGVHAPEFEYERDADAIAEAASSLGVTWPIALDTNRLNFRSWQGSPAYWPRTYVIDADGNIRFDHIGEGAYDDLARTIELLLEQT